MSTGNVIRKASDKFYFGVWHKAWAQRWSDRMGTVERLLPVRRRQDVSVRRGECTATKPTLDKTTA
jgi:hypothetical protein